MGENMMGWDGPIAGAIEDETVYHYYDNSKARAVGFYSLQAITVGAGTLTITYELSNVPDAAPADFIASGATAIVTAMAAGSGFYQWPVAGENIFAKHIRLKLVATGVVAYTFYPNVQ